MEKGSWRNQGSVWPYSIIVVVLFVVAAVGFYYFIQPGTPPNDTSVTTTDTSYDMGVLVLKYFPVTDDGLIDIEVTGDVGDPYSIIRKRVDDVTEELRRSLEKASTYLGYKDPNAKPALRYTIVDTKEYLEVVPTITNEGKPTYYPNYRSILTRENICDYVQNKNVKEVWLWEHQGPKQPDTSDIHGPYIDVPESKMSGPNGDISNSYRSNDLPDCGRTYRLYNFNYGRLTPEAMESWGHQIEAEFMGPAHPQASNEIGRCGSVHNPPNARNEYDRNNPTPQKSDCLDWDPDGLGKLSNISCEQWGCGEDDPIHNNAHLNYQIWMFQNFPGRGNTKTYQGKQLRNWWDVHGDFDNVMRSRKRLTID